MPPLRFDILTTFPEMFDASDSAALSASIPGRARAAGLVEWHATNIRTYAQNTHSKTDDRPFGGGPGMYDAVMAVEAADPRPATRVLMTPQGKPLTQAVVRELGTKPRVLLIAGHYEGIDERVIEKLAPMEVSIGDYVLSSGELAAMVVMDAVIRLLPGALGHEQSAAEDSFAEHEGVPLLDCPHYTRPREWMGMAAPDVLMSGDHGAVAKWRLAERLKRTKERRPDLLG
jgi:tRNA (guanine37-N1)-methyltransferase